jgi:soluble lytic murein transglycosylase
VILFVKMLLSKLPSEGFSGKKSSSEKSLSKKSCSRKLPSRRSPFRKKFVENFSVIKRMLVRFIEQMLARFTGSMPANFTFLGLSATLCLIFCLTIFSKENNFENIRQHISSGEYALAISKLEKLRKENQKLFEAGNYDYLLARLSEKEGDFALAAASYQSVINRDSVLKEYAAWHLARISRFSRNSMFERIFLYETLLESPKSLLQRASRKRLAQSFYESQDFSEAERILFFKPFQLNSFGNIGIGERDELLLFGLTLLQNGKLEKAREIFIKVLTTTPNALQADDLDLKAVQKLDEIDGINDKATSSLSDEEHFQRGKIYNFNREFEKARFHFSVILEKFPQFAGIAECLSLIGKSYFSEGNYNEAIKWFERVIAEFPDTEFAKDALSQVASAYSRVNKPREAIARYKKFIEKYNGDENISRAYLNIVDTLRDMGEESDALFWLDKTINDFKGKYPEAVARFTKVRIKMAQNNYTNSLKELEELEKIIKTVETTNVSGGTTLSEVRFLKGYCLEQLKEYREAVETYLSIPDGLNSYYGWRATERLKLLAENEASKPIVLQRFNYYFSQAEQKTIASNAEQIRQSAQMALRLTNDAEKRKKLLEKLKESYALLPAYRKLLPERELEVEKIITLANSSRHKQIAFALLSLGLYDEGTPELELALRKEKSPSKDAGISGFPPEVAYTLAEYYIVADMPYRALVYLESIWKNVPSDYELEAISRPFLRLLYPTPYKDLLLTSREKSKVDPRFVLAIMRQESKFQPYAKSVSAARGLMQFIPSTANQIANELQLKDFSTDYLYDPKIAILIGNAYLAKLFLTFPNQPQAVAGAYNAGEKNMMRWFLRAKSDEPDRYVPEIMFVQSKDYVQKVMTNYHVYKAIYDENLEAVKSF